MNHFGKDLNVKLLFHLKFIWLFKSHFDRLNDVRASYGIPITSNPFEKWQNTLLLVDTFFGYEVSINNWRCIDVIKKRYKLTYMIYTYRFRLLCPHFIRYGIITYWGTVSNFVKIFTFFRKLGRFYQIIFLRWLQNLKNLLYRTNVQCL